MVKRLWILLAAAVLACWEPAWAAAGVWESPLDQNGAHYLTGGTSARFTWDAATTGDQLAIRATGCRLLSVTAEFASGSGPIALYQVPTATTATSSGTLMGSFSATSRIPQDFDVGPYFVRPAVTVGSVGSLTARCTDWRTRRGGGGVNIGITASGYLTEDGAQYLWRGGPPTRLNDRAGGWSDRFFSSDVAGGHMPTVGSDANDCLTPATPCLTTDKIETVLAPGVRVVLDAGDDWNTATTMTGDFILNQATIGCPVGNDVCVWITTTAGDKTLDPVTWGNPAGTARFNFNVTSDGTRRGWIFVDGIALSPDGSLAGVTDADGWDTDELGQLWVHNGPVTVVAGDATDNAATAHDGGISFVSGVSPLRVATGSTGDNAPVQTAGGGVVGVITRQVIDHEEAAAPHNSDIAAAACGGACSTTPGDYEPAVVLIGPHLSCSGGQCSTTSSLLELNPDQVHASTPTSRASALVAFTSFDHATAVGTHAVNPVASSSNEAITWRGYRNSYLTVDRVFSQANGVLVEGTFLDFIEIGYVADEPEGGGAGDGAILHLADASWKTCFTRFTLRAGVFDNDDGGGGADNQCYLEDAGGDVNSTTLTGCQTGINALAGVTGTWSLAGTLAANQSQHPAGASTLATSACMVAEECDDLVSELFVEPFPNGIVLPAVFGPEIRGVRFGERGSAVVASDAGRI